MAFTDDLEALVQKFAPMLRLHPAEVNFPWNVTDYVAQVEYVESNGTIHQPGWSWSAMPLASGDYLQIPDANAPAIEAGDLTTAQVYVHAVTVPGVTGQIDLQYWIFYPFNGSETMRVESWAGGSAQQSTNASWHQGDWEVVKVRVDESESIVAVYMSEHSGGVWLPPAPAGDPSAGFSVVNKTHPVAYVAQGSHAHYPIAGGPFEIGGVDLAAIEITMVDYTADGGKAYDLSQAGRCVIVANDCPGIFSFKPDPSDTSWITFKGDWGAPMLPLSPVDVMKLMTTVLGEIADTGGVLGKAISAALIYLASGPFIGVTANLALIGALFGPLFDPTEGPHNPTVQGSWSSSPAVLFWGTDKPISKSSWSNTMVQIAFAGGGTGTIGECFYPQQWSPFHNPQPVHWISLQGGNWIDRGPLQNVQTEGAVAVGFDPATQVAILSSCVGGQLNAWSAPYMESGNWQKIASFPGPAALSAATFAKVGGTWMGVFVSPTSDDPATTHQLAVISSSDLNSWSAPTPIEGTACSPPIWSLWAPSGVIFNGSLLVAYSAQPISGAPGPEVMIATFDGTNWLPPIGIGGAYACAGGASLAVVDGIVVCCFADSKKQVRYATSEDGVTWTQSGALRSALSTMAPSIAVVGSELVCVHPGKGSPTIWYNMASVPS